MPAGGPDNNPGCGPQDYPAGELGRRDRLRWRGARTLIVLECPIAVRPLLIAMAFAVDETAIVNLSGSAGGGLRGRDSLRWRGARTLIALISPIAVGPLLIAMAFAVDKTAIVDVTRAPRHGRSQAKNRGCYQCEHPCLHLRPPSIAHAQAAQCLDLETMVSQFNALCKSGRSVGMRCGKKAGTQPLRHAGVIRQAE